MTGNNIIYCFECAHCFKSRRSKTAYACEVWGYDDFACCTRLDGFCHKAKPRGPYDKLDIDSGILNELLKLKKGE
jgi:hypothetical protein